MKPAPFAYHRPATLDEAVETLAATGGKVLAGGQSLVPIMSMRLASPAALVDLNHIAGLDVISVDDGGVRIGALDATRALELDPAAYAANPLLRSAAAVRRASDDPQPRHDGRESRACRPGGRDAGRARLLGGSVEATEPRRGARGRIAAADFFVGPLESALEPDEIAVARVLPPPARRARGLRGSSSRGGTATTPWSASVRSSTDASEASCVGAQASR